MDNTILAVARKIVRDCAGLKEREETLLVGDGHDPEIVEVFRQAIIDLQGEPVIIFMRPGNGMKISVPDALSLAMCNASLILMLSGTPIVRSAATDGALRNKARIIIMNRLAKPMLLRKSFQADFVEISKLCRSLAAGLTQADLIRVQTRIGTDLTIDVKTRNGNALTGIPLPGEIHCLPNIEANIAPNEQHVSGKLVIDGGIPHLNLSPLKEPITLAFEGGRVTSVTGGEEADVFQQKVKETGDLNVKTVAEFGIGLNPYCELIGIPVEDEGKLGTAHIAVGDNSLFGGENKSAFHYDLIFNKPDIYFDNVQIMRQGSLEL